MAEVIWSERQVSVAGGTVTFLTGGSGSPVLILPKDNGHPPGNAFAAALAAQHTVYVPFYPGFHGSRDVAEWESLWSVRDLVVVLRQAIEALGLDGLRIVGSGFGGWIAAEFASMGTRGIESLVLVNPMGIQPREGYIYDQFLVGSEAYARQGFADQAAFDALYGAEPEYDQLDAWETDRAMTSRLAWKPYMYNATLPRLLASVNVPAHIIVGDADRVVPPECAELYRQALPDATLETMPGCGHAIDAEFPEALASAVTTALTRARA